MAIVRIEPLNQIIIHAERFTGTQMEITEVKCLTLREPCECRLTNLPHIHIASNKGYLLKPGDWVIRYSQQGHADILSAMTDDDFKKEFRIIY